MPSRGVLCSLLCDGFTGCIQKRQGCFVRAVNYCVLLPRLRRVVRQLYPFPLEIVDPDIVYAQEDRPVFADRPYLLVNMVSSLDGGVTLDGRTRGLSGDADRELFHALRIFPDAILAGAGTVRAERYCLPSLSVEQQQQRQARGQARLPQLIVASARLVFDWDLPLFLHSSDRPLLLVPNDVDPVRREEATQYADLLMLSRSEDGQGVDLVAGMRELRHRGIKVLLVEGGPSLNERLLSAGLVDEVCLALSPLLLGSEAGKGASRLFGHADLLQPVSFSLQQVLAQDDFLFLRYRVKT